MKWTPDKYSCQSTAYIFPLPPTPQDEIPSLILGLLPSPNYWDHRPGSFKCTQSTNFPHSLTLLSQQISSQLKTAKCSNGLQCASLDCSCRTCITDCFNAACIPLAPSGPTEREHQAKTDRQTDRQMSPACTPFSLPVL